MTDASAMAFLAFAEASLALPKVSCVTFKIEIKIKIKILRYRI